ncbi:MAG: ABC transporter ATP-binding protein [Desulfobacterales bacterium]
MIVVSELHKAFSVAEGMVLDGISFTLGDGETLSVIGPSGCGKTTLLYLMAGLSSPTRGSVTIRGRRDTGTKGRTAFILQDFGLFPWKTTSENIGLGLRLRGMPAREREALTAGLMTDMGLAGLGNRYPAQLSGGQKQRVAIARALAVEPDIILMDEPFSSLDAITREHLQETMIGMWRKKEVSYIIVTHSVEEAVMLGRRILVLTDRPTRVKAMVENPDFGSPGYRIRECFFDRTRAVRRILET